jgi:protein TonB
VRVELRQESIAAIVLDAEAHRPRRRLRRAFARSLADGSLAAIVLGRSSVRRGLVGTALFIAAALLHVGAGLAALASRSEDRDSDVSVASRPPLRIDHVVDLEPAEPQPLPPEPPRRVMRARAVEQAPRPAPPEATLPSEVQQPADAGRVVAADEGATEPLDFTRFSIRVGHGPRFAGGVTASSGSSARAVHTPVVDRGAHPNAGAGVSRARPVGPPRRDWDCPWPAEAAALSVDEQFVVVRAVVRADGTVASAQLISDPGYGFGEVALACARKQRFPAATDDDGRPITATSPPIHVRFTRP